MYLSSTILLALLAAASPRAETQPTSQPPSARDQEIRQRVGLMSEEVAREKLARYGVTNVRTFRLVDYTFEIEAEQEGRPISLQLDATRGVLRERGKLMALTPSSAALSFIPKPDQDEVKRFDEMLRYEVRPTLDRTPPPHMHVRPERQP